MQKLFRHPLAGLLALLLILPAEAAPKVLVTIKPVHSMVAAVMQGVAKPELLINTAAGHSSHLKPSDGQKIAAADIIFEVGPMLESGLEKPLKTQAKGQVVELADSKGIKLLPVRSGTPPEENRSGAATQTDPHIWLSPLNAAAMIRAIRDTLKKADPAHAQSYNFNAKMEIMRINDMAMSIGSKLMLVHKRRYLVLRDAYQYFEKYFDLHPVSGGMLQPGAPLSPQQRSRVHRIIRDKQVQCVFRDTSFTPALLSQLKMGAKIRVDVLDPLGSDLPAGPTLYRQMMQNIAGTLAQCLG